MRKLLASAAVAAFAILAVTTPAHAAPPDHAAQNSEAYWEGLGYGDCTKTELPDGVGSTTLPPVSFPTVYSLLVLKAGSGQSANELVHWPDAGVAYDHGTGKDLSHIIVCTVTQYS